VTDRLQSDAELRMSGVAACVLDALPDLRASRALDMHPKVYRAYITRLCVRYQAPNRVGLALALQREVMGWQ